MSQPLRYADQQLKAINDAKDDQMDLLKKYGASAPLNFLLSLNFNDRLKVDLPEGMPPYNRDESTHQDFQGTLAGVIQRLRNCFTDVQLPKMKKEHIFIQILEAIPPNEADVLVHAKDKALHEMFPNITKEMVESVFPNYVK